MGVGGENAVGGLIVRPLAHGKGCGRAPAEFGLRLATRPEWLVAVAWPDELGRAAAETEELRGATRLLAGACSLKTVTGPARVSGCYPGPAHVAALGSKDGLASQPALPRDQRHEGENGTGFKSGDKTRPNLAKPLI